MLAEKVKITSPRIKSGSANPGPKLATLIAGMCAGADCIDDVDLVRSGGMNALFGGVYAPSTIGTLLREFTFGHARQLDRVLAAHLGDSAARRRCCRASPGAPTSTSTRCCARSTATRNRARPTDTPRSPGNRSSEKVCPRWRPRSAPTRPHPVIAGMRLRAGQAGSGKGAARMIARAIGTARADRRDRQDPGARRFRLRQPQGRQSRVCVTTRQFSLRYDPQPGDQPGHRRDR